MLTGKAAVLYFYEESWPKCTTAWPELLAVANKYQGEPIVFIAVNSGNSVSKVASYLKKNGITWPTIVDSARKFEAAAGIGEISLKNIRGHRVLDADGSLKSSAGLEYSANLALTNAKWNIDPNGLPDSLRGCWQAIEFGDFVSESRTLARALKSKKTEVQTTAQTLNAYVQGKLTATLDQAAEAKTAGDQWLAYKTYQEFQHRFKGHDTEVNEIMEQYPDTEAAQKAQEVLESAEGS